MMLQFFYSYICDKMINIEDFSFNNYSSSKRRGISYILKLLTRQFSISGLAVITVAGVYMFADSTK